MKINRTDMPTANKPKRLRPGPSLWVAGAAACVLLGGTGLTLLGATAMLEPVQQIAAEAALPVQSVMGQSGDDVLFYPWPLYEGALTLENCPLGETLDYFSSLAYPFTAFGVPLSGPVEARQFMLATKVHYSQDFYMFLSDYPVELDSRTPVQLSMALASEAMGKQSVSYLWQPAQQDELSQEQVDAALTRVKEDLHDYLVLAATNKEMLRSAADLGEFAWPKDNQLVNALRAGEETDFLFFDFVPNALYSLQQYVQVGWDFAYAIAPQNDPFALTLDDFLDQQNAYGTYAVQLITTPRQILVLFTINEYTLGVYYDIQMGRYSGVGYAN